MHLPITSSTPARARVCRGVPSAISAHHACAIGALPIPCRLLDVIGDQSLESFTPSDLPDRAEGTLRTKHFGEGSEVELETREACPVSLTSNQIFGRPRERARASRAAGDC